MRSVCNGFCEQQRDLHDFLFGNKTVCHLPGTALNTNQYRRNACSSKRPTTQGVMCARESRSLSYSNKIQSQRILHSNKFNSNLMLLREAKNRRSASTAFGCHHIAIQPIHIGFHTCAPCDDDNDETPTNMCEGEKRLPKYIQDSPITELVETHTIFGFCRLFFSPMYSYDMLPKANDTFAM